MKDSKFYDDWFRNLPWKEQNEIIDYDLAEMFREGGGYIDETGEWWEEKYEVAIEPENYWYEYLDVDDKDEIYRKYNSSLKEDSQIGNLRSNLKSELYDIFTCQFGMDQKAAAEAIKACNLERANRFVESIKGVFSVNENMKKDFDYKEYLTEGWMFQEAGAKDDYFTRQRRAQQGNWKGSVGKYVEDHRAEIDAAAKQGHGELRAYVRTTMMPALEPEAQEYLEQLLTGYANDRALHQALYNILLKGQGLGLHEEKAK